MAQKTTKASPWKQYAIRYLEETTDPAASLCQATAEDFEITAVSKKQALFLAKKERGDTRQALSFTYGDHLICGYTVVSEKLCSKPPRMAEVTGFQKRTLYESYDQREAYHAMRSRYGTDKILSFESAVDHWMTPGPEQFKAPDKRTSDILADHYLERLRREATDEARKNGYEGSYLQLVSSEEQAELVEALSETHRILKVDRDGLHSISLPGIGSTPRQVMVLPDKEIVLGKLYQMRTQDVQDLLGQMQENQKKQRQLFDDFVDIDETQCEPEY